MTHMTKKALADSLKKLLRTKPITKVTINDITETCGVNRMTFYYHFKDIYDLVEWIFDDSIQNVLSDKQTYGTWENGLLEVIKAYEENRYLILNVYHYVGVEYIVTYLNKTIYQMIYQVVENHAKDMNISDDDKEMIAEFYKFAIVGMLMDWIYKGMKEKPERIVENISIVSSGNVDEVLKKLEEEKSGGCHGS